MPSPDITAFTRMTRGFMVLGAVIVVGVTGYLLTGWSLLDSIYMVVITIFGVGYGEVRSIEAPELKLFTMALIISGCSALIYILGGFFQMIAEGELNRALGKLRMTKQINNLEGHIIICGYGRIGRVLADELAKADVKVVVVDGDEKRIARAGDSGCLVYHGNASHEETLRRAGIDRARALCSVVPDDAMNVFITLTARSMNPTLSILARGEDPETASKLKQAGANEVVLPSAICATQMSDLIVRPEALDFLKRAELHGVDGDLKALGLGVRTLTLEASANGRTVGALEQAAQVSLMIVAIQHASGSTTHRPALDVLLNEGDTVIVVTHAEDVETLKFRFAEEKRVMRYRGGTIQQ